MCQKLTELKQNLDWIERLDVTNAPAGDQGVEEVEEGDLANNDFKRELRL